VLAVSVQSGSGGILLTGPTASTRVVRSCAVSGLIDASLGITAGAVYESTVSASTGGGTGLTGIAGGGVWNCLVHDLTAATGPLTGISASQAGVTGCSVFNLASTGAGFAPASGISAPLVQNCSVETVEGPAIVTGILSLGSAALVTQSRATAINTQGATAVTGIAGTTIVDCSVATVGGNGQGSASGILGAMVRNCQVREIGAASSASAIGIEAPFAGQVIGSTVYQVTGGATVFGIAGGDGSTRDCTVAGVAPGWHGARVSELASSPEAQHRRGHATDERSEEPA